MRKIVKLIISIILSIILSLALYFGLSNRDLVINFFDMGTLLICSGSMEPELEIGDIIIIKKYDNYEIGDIVTYLDDDNILVTHRIIEKTENGFVLKGDNNNTKDKEIVNKDIIAGKVICNSKILRFIYTYWVYVILIVILLIIIF